MTTNQTIDGVSRELLEILLMILDEKPPYSYLPRYEWAQKLRALLDAPAVLAGNKCGVQMVDCPECSHQWDHFFECGNGPAAQLQGEGDPVACRPGLYAVRHIDNCVGERDIVLSFARLEAAGKWTYEETGGDLLTYRGDKILKVWPLDCADASAAPVACLNSIGGDQ